MDDTYGIVSGPDGVTIEWPRLLTSDNALVAFIQDLRKYGVPTSTKIDHSTGRMVVITNKVKAIYKRGLYQEPMPFESFKDWVYEKAAPTPITMPEPKAAWIFEEEIQMYPVLTPMMVMEESKPREKDYATLSSELARHIPDIRKKVKPPCSCGKKKKAEPVMIWALIQHLNDDHHPDRKVAGRRRKDIWTRERIADWLDEVDADLTFDPDLPAKRAAEREAARQRRKEQTVQMINQTNAALTQATTELQSEFMAIGEVAKKTAPGMVTLSTAISEYAQSLKHSASPLCVCTMCKTTKEES